jgi:protein-L-isoaspartate(D-aspartate) O-methyltransferase
LTVVIFAEKADIPVDAVVRELTARSIPIFRADTSWFPRSLVLEALLDGDGTWVGVLATGHRAMDRRDTPVTVLAENWQDRVRQLAQGLVAAGKLWSAPWQEALCAVPRHELVPDVLSRDPDGSWHRLDTTTAQGQQDWLEQVYSNKALLTAAADRPGPHSLRSSSSMPGLMTRMLEALDVHDGHRVLEIGTGTGYNTALLTHRLGDANVFSVDIEPDLLELARQRLARIGYHPTLVAANGAAGLAEHAPFDRIIATCAVPALPWAWVEQTNPGGVILTDLKTARGAGSLVRLTRYPDRAEGRFDPTYAAFMDLRHHPAAHAPDRPRPRRQPHSQPEQEPPHWTPAPRGTAWWCGFWPASRSASTSPSAMAAPTRTGTPPSPSSPWATAPGRRSPSPTTRESTKSVKAAHVECGDSSKTPTPCGPHSDSPIGTASASPSPQTTNESG